MRILSTILIAAALLGTAAFTAQADGRDNRRGYDRGHDRGYRYGPPAWGHYRRSAPPYYGPRYYRPPPVFYAPRPYYRPAPPPGIYFRF